MSKRGVGNPSSKLPDNPVWIEFPRSDGDQRTWPTHTEYKEDSAGQVNWMKALPLDHPVALKWRLVVGHALAMDTGRQPAKDAVVKDWPAEYRMYDHHKGPARGNIRHDIYLYGPVSRRFRSPMEFVPHALWLCRDPTMDTKNCYCKYCKKIPQKVISGALDSIIQTPSQSVSAPPATQGTSNNDAGSSSATQITTTGKDIYTALQRQGWARRDRDRDAPSLSQRRAHREQRVRQKGKGKANDGDGGIPKVFAAVQKRLKPASTIKPSEYILDMPMLAQRNRDLRAVYSRSANDKLGVYGRDDGDETAMMNLGIQHGTGQQPVLSNQENPPLRRWFRQSEVVWVQLPGEGVRLTEPGEEYPLNITAWPAIVNGPKVKNIAIPINTPNAVGHSVASGSAYASHPQGKPLDSVSINQEATLNGSPRTSSSGTRSFFQYTPSATPLLQAQSSSADVPAAPLPPSVNTSLPSTSQLSPANAQFGSNRPISDDVPTSTAMDYESVHSNRARQSSSDSLNTESANWTVKESTIYSVRLMGSDAKLDVPDQVVLPYLAHAPVQELIDFLKAAPPDYLNLDRDNIGRYNPFTASTLQEKDEDQMDEESYKKAVQRAHDAASAFSLAVQIAATLCGYWSLTDRWEFLYAPPAYETGDVRVNVVSRNTSGKSEDVESDSLAPTAGSATAPRTLTTTTVVGGLSLHSAIEAAGRSNATGASTFSKKTNLNAVASNGPIYKELSGTSNSMTEQEVREVAASALGVGANGLNNGDGASGSSSTNVSGGVGSRNGLSGALTQVRFQGMWWGPERIWVDDFVRLKIGRAALAPDGAPNVYKASGWGKKNVEGWAEVARVREERKQPLETSASPQNENGKGKERDMDLTYLPEVPAYQGANLRGVFMKIDGLFIVDVPKRDGKLKREGRVCGMLYELAEIDWEETEPDLKEQYETEMQERQAYLKRRGSPFQASVNESLLPSVSKNSGPSQAPLLQPAPPSHYLIPQAPKGYRFRPILKAGYEAVLNLSLVSGRYYPRLLSHPSLAGTINRAMTNGRRDGNLRDYNNLFALEGLCAGHFNAVDPTVHKKSRVQMIEDSDLISMQEMEKFQMSKESEWVEKGDEQDMIVEEADADGTSMEPDAMHVD